MLLSYYRRFPVCKPTCSTIHRIHHFHHIFQIRTCRLLRSTSSIPPTVPCRYSIRQVGIPMQTGMRHDSSHSSLSSHFLTYEPVASPAQVIGRREPTRSIHHFHHIHHIFQMRTCSVLRAYRRTSIHHFAPIKLNLSRQRLSSILSPREWKHPRLGRGHMCSGLRIEKHNASLSSGVLVWPASWHPP